MAGASDLGSLDLEHILADCICLLEWPDRLDDELVPESRLEVCIRIEDPRSDMRAVYLTPHGERWAARVDEVHGLGALGGAAGADARGGEFDPH